MTVSNPLLKSLKEHVKTFTELDEEVNDSHDKLYKFCECLEKCFQRGIAIRFNAIGIPNFTEAWDWIDELSRNKHESLFLYQSIVDDVRKNQKVITSGGKLRLFIRSCLNRKCLHLPINYIIRIAKVANNYYNCDSIIGDEILGEIFYSVLLQISYLKFRLNLRNASFLDETWELTDTYISEFVPCRTLGISICFTGGKSLITKIEPNSVIGEDKNIELGDVLDEINGQVISSHTRGNLKRIMHKAIGYPVTLHIIKLRNKKGDLHYPLARIIRNSGLEYMKYLLAREPPDTNIHNQCKILLNKNKEELEEKPGHIVFEYCGSIKIGKYGDVKQIEPAIKNFLDSGISEQISCKFECQELGINVHDIKANKIIMKYSYMDIASCGRSSKFPEHFGFITGKTICNSSAVFEAHIFFHKHINQIDTLLQTLGQGFYRTHFVV